MKQEMRLQVTSRQTIHSGLYFIFLLEIRSGPLKLIHFSPQRELHFYEIKYNIAK